MPHLFTDDGFRLYYEKAGSGSPVVFVHEFAGNYRSWEPQVRYFSRRPSARHTSSACPWEGSLHFISA